MSDQDTICALATPAGQAGVAVIRISGPSALEMCQQLTHKKLQARYAHLSRYFDQDDAVIDQGLVIYFPKPNSFTGEEVVEIHPHGNPYICQQLLTRLTQLGARLAIAGEFSERAFLNGKLDLAQLEAIADLIASGSEQAAQSAVLSMQGKFSEQVNDILQQLILIRTHIEASLDFADEDIELETREKIAQLIIQLQGQLSNMTEVAKQGAKLQQGATLVLTGKPNVGKSSLFNALCTQNRAIVTDIPGTTRDVVGMDINIQGVSLRLLDTAGIREQADAVEKEGIARAQQAMQSADCIIHVYDHELDHKRVNELANIHDENTASRVDQRSIVVINKADLLDKENHNEHSPNEQSPVADEPLYISAKTGAGLDQLKQQIIKVLGLQSIDQQPPFSARLRHIEALTRAAAAIDIALQHINSDTPLELSAEECRTAQQCLAEITGEFTPDDLLDYVFREFCIGK